MNSNSEGGNKPPMGKAKQVDRKEKPYASDHEVFHAKWTDIERISYTNCSGVTHHRLEPCDVRNQYKIIRNLMKLAEMRKLRIRFLRSSHPLVPHQVVGGVVSELCKTVPDLLSDIDPSVNYSLWIDQFLAAAEECGYLKDGVMTSKCQDFRVRSEASIGSIEELFIKAAASFRSPEFKKKLKHLQQNAKRQLESARLLADTICVLHDEIFVVRMDLGFSEKIGDAAGVDHTRALLEAREKICGLMASAPEFDGCVGYVMSVEYGVIRHSHIHVLFFFKAGDKGRSSKIALNIGRRWVAVTSGKGYFHDCSKGAPSYKKVATGQYRTDNIPAMMELYLALYYMTKMNEFFRVKVPEGAQAFTRSNLPIPGIVGRRRVRRGAVIPGQEDLCVYLPKVSRPTYLDSLTPEQSPGMRFAIDLRNLSGWADEKTWQGLLAQSPLPGFEQHVAREVFVLLRQQGVEDGLNKAIRQRNKSLRNPAESPLSKVHYRRDSGHSRIMPSCSAKAVSYEEEVPAALVCSIAVTARALPAGEVVADPESEDASASLQEDLTDFAADEDVNIEIIRVPRYVSVYDRDKRVLTKVRSGDFLLRKRRDKRSEKAKPAASGSDS